MNCSISTLVSIILGVLSSIIAALIFWYFSFYRSNVKIEFSPNIEKSKSRGEYAGNFRYRIRLKNMGKRDLLDVSMQVKLIANENYTHLGIGNDSMMPIIPGKKKLEKYGSDHFAHTVSIYPIEATYNQFKKAFYSKDIQEKANKKVLSLDDIFDEIEYFKIEVYVFGYNKITGVRKMYFKSYSKDDVMEGDFNSDKSKMELIVKSCKTNNAVEH